MDENKVIRWKQRFGNMQKAMPLLRNTVMIENPSEAEKAGGIQFFEVAFELTWKTLKDYLESKGYTDKNPREVLKKCFEIGIIENGESLLEALKDRNLTVHLYDEKEVDKIVSRIKNKYLPAMNQIEEFLAKEYEE